MEVKVAKIVKFWNEKFDESDKNVNIYLYLESDQE
jgi:hypothetical protein